MEMVDWEQRRYEIAKDVLCAFLQKYNNGYKMTAEKAVECADALIEVLKDE